MSDDANVRGVPVLRWPGWQAAWKYEETERSPVEVRSDAGLREDVEPGTWHRMSDEAQVKRQDVAMDEMDEATPAEAKAFARGVLATLRTLGLST